MTYDPDPLYVPEPDSDEAHYEAAAAYFERLDYERLRYYQRHGFGRFILVAWLFPTVLIILAILAAALLIGGGR